MTASRSMPLAISSERKLDAMCVSNKGMAAVQALVDVALHQGDGYVVLSAVGARLMLSASYVEQIFATLRRHGFVVGTRGPGGGYRLAHSAELIRVSDIILAMQESRTVEHRRKHEWQDGHSGRDATGMVYALSITLNRKIFEFLDSVSLMDLIEGTGLDGVSSRGRRTRKKTGATH
ncbi:Rrf2 family transcriptional regulator [Herbaspirillum sp. ST 5-3]|uniref:Rrf2 family transcriptional regulator n=1 Tax=Oxalobacteraceae TaxID=75682 RepID=UPI0010A4FB05|nr:Rrf2 family transcriptional regulator [Herbaspirillum sp. ST 5-3]